MENSMLFSLGFDPAYIVIALCITTIILFILLISCNLKYSRLKSKYNIFMKGKDGRSMEVALVQRFKQLDAVTRVSKKNEDDIRNIKRDILSNYQKFGIVKYDAFNEMGGKLSFALTLLDAKDNGWVMNAMHSREGCYTYIKEIVKGKSYIELSEEEAESLERAVYQEGYGLGVNNESIEIK